MFFSLLLKCKKVSKLASLYFYPGKIKQDPIHHFAGWNILAGLSPFQPYELSHDLCSPSSHMNCVHTICCSFHACLMQTELCLHCYQHQLHLYGPLI